MAVQEFQNIGLPWPLFFDASTILMGISACWYFIRYFEAKYITQKEFQNYVLQKENAYKTQTDFIEIQLSNIKKEVSETRTMLQHQSDAFHSLILKLATEKKV